MREWGELLIDYLLFGLLVFAGLAVVALILMMMILITTLWSAL